MTQLNAIELLAELVRRPSVNPAHTQDEGIANEFRVTDFLADLLEQKGFALEWDRATHERASVVARFGPAQPRFTLMFEGHTDTVGVAGMEIPPFDPQIREGRLYGRGACDTKGPIAAALTALTPDRMKRLADHGIQLIFVAAFGEEKGNLGAERLVEHGLGADAAIILEPTEGALVYAHKGALWYELTLTGEPAHSSDPAKGLSAISATAELIQWLQTDILRDQANGQDQALGPPTLNVGRIEGGVAINIVPQHCRLEVDRRMVPGEDPAVILQPLEAQLEQMKLSGRIRAYTLKVVKAGLPFITQTGAPLIQQLSRAIADVGEPVQLTTAAWFSDAGPFAQTCREIVVYGPGSIHQAHTKNEFIELDALQTGQRVFERYLDDLMDQGIPKD